MRRLVVPVLLLAVIFITNTSFFIKPDYSILIDKSDYNLYVFENDEWLITYPVVFGNKDQGDKMMEGDRKTPEGTFKILTKRVHEKWCRFLMLDYPNEQSRQKFNDRKTRGLIPQGAKIGGAIGIHGTWPREDFAVDKFQNWTMGCISMKNEHVKQLYEMISNGTTVTIRK
jgi:murein L,D-transpeptidase YafK